MRVQIYPGALQINLILNLLLILITSQLMNCKNPRVSYETAISNLVSSIDTVYGMNGNTLYHTRFKMEGIIGAQLPDFTDTTITGKVIDSKFFSGKVSVINFWFEGCKPCEAEMPGLNKLVEKYKSDATNFIAIGLNSPEDIREFLSRKPFHFDHIAYGKPIIEGKFKHRWGYPMTIIADKDLKIIHVQAGGLEDSTAIESIQKQLIPVIDDALRK